MIDAAKALKKENKLTASLIQKALQEDEIAFLEAGLSVQSGRSVEHVRSVISRAGMDAIVQLLVSAGIQQEMHEEFRAGFERIRLQ